MQRRSFARCSCHDFSSNIAVIVLWQIVHTNCQCMKYSSFSWNRKTHRVTCKMSLLKLASLWRKLFSYAWVETRKKELARNMTFPWKSTIFDFIIPIQYKTTKMSCTPDKKVWAITNLSRWWKKVPTHGRGDILLMEMALCNFTDSVFSSQYNFAFPVAVFHVSIKYSKWLTHHTCFMNKFEKF